MVSVIIVAWNAEEIIADAVCSCIMSPQVSQVIVVDNNSQDNTLTILNGLSSEKILVISSRSNLGFGRACNLGVLFANNEYILFLNPDTKLSDETIEIALATLEDGIAEVVGAKTVDDGGAVHRSCARFPNLRMLLIDSLGLSKINPHIFKGYFMNDWNHLDSRYVDHVIGAFYFLKRELYLEVGGMDERFFLYYEDLDLSNKIKENGGRIYYNSEAVCFHEGGGTSKAIKAKRLFYVMDSRVKYAFKNLGSARGLIYLLSLLTLERLIRTCDLLVRMDFEGVKNVNDAYRIYINKIFRSSINSRE